ncbi:Jnk1/mapk8-associated membrane protein [Elysia marginata]|uniref:Jnk1/mapk8-associated membrane protein n=1 Tax=Elysia marginata TaxID=1093978 RepID=A0AAV4JM35_9GAST|nr:Jnk1/mapk8-associated membrane protein [Elysia marginata]
MSLFVQFLVCILLGSALLKSVNAHKELSKYPFIKGYTGNITCPGRYCGRAEVGAECGACPRGYAPDASSICHRCDSNPSFYDWLYLGFMALVPLVLHWTFIDLFCRPKRCLCLFDLSAFIETVLSAWLTVFLMDPAGKMTVRSCSVEQFSDWYTLFFNPTPDYYDTIYCTQEIVFPL